MTTFIYTPTLDYPKKYLLDLTKKEKKSFDIDNKTQVADFIGLALERIYKNSNGKPSDDTLSKSGQTIEGMLEGDFGEYLDGRSYKVFVMDYILKNFEKARKKDDGIRKGIEKGLLS